MTYDLLAGVVTEQAFDLVADPGETDDLAFGTGALPDTLPLGEAFCREVGARVERSVAFNAAGQKLGTWVPLTAHNLLGEKAVFMLTRKGM